MLSLFEGYLLIFVALFAVNIGLFLGNFKTNNLKAIIVAVLSGILLIGVNSISGYFKDSLSFLAGNFGYLFIVAAAVLFVLTWIFLKKENNFRRWQVSPSTPPDAPDKVCRSFPQKSVWAKILPRLSLPVYFRL